MSIRGIVALVILMLGGTDPWRLPASSVVLLVLLTVLLRFLDVHLRRERVLLGNLAVRSGGLAVLFAVPAAVGELLIVLLTHPMR